MIPGVAFVAAALLLVAPAMVLAVPPGPLEATPVERPRTCLVLGGGGARGAAHIGLLRVLERERVPVDCIVGTSMGAVVGGMYSAGYSADEIESILEGIDWNDVLHDRTPREQRSVRNKQEDLRRLGGIELGLRNGKIALPQGVIQGQRLELLLRRLMLPTWQVAHFDDLPIPFRAVAADIVTGEKVVFEKGELAMAIRASMSVPGAFAPVRVDGRLLVDGGVLDNVPIDEARKLGAERLIVSRVGSPLADEAHLDSPLAVSQQTARMLMKQIVEAQIATLEPDDLLIAPQLGSIGAQDFNRAAEASAIGLAAAEEDVVGIRRYGVDEAAYAKFRKGHVLPQYDAPLVAFVEVLKDRTRTGEAVENQLGGLQGAPLDAVVLESRLAEAYGEGRYQQLQWRLVDGSEGTGLQVEPEDKRWGPDFLHGSLRLSSDLDGKSEYQLSLEYTKTGLNARGGESSVRLGLGRIDSLAGEFHQPFGWKNGHALSIQAGYRAFDLPLLAVDDAEIAQFRYDIWGGGIGWRFSPSHRWEISLDAGRYRDRTRLLVGEPGRWSGSGTDLTEVALGLRYDTLDDSAFPRSGQRLDASYRRYLNVLGSDVEADVAGMSWDGVVSRGPHSLLAGLAVSSASDEGEQVLAAQGFLGGLGRLSGYQEGAVFAPQTVLARAVYYRRIGHADGLMRMPVHLGGSLELGGHWRRRGDIDRDGLTGAASVFLGLGTAIGPILIGYGRAEHGVDSFYLIFGSLLHDRSNP